ncbi:hypothetical protein D5P15_03035 [Salmonella enterica subsp. enterica serovar Livingstone]|nr:hypothetical protein [Salmonella enterica subsp. enterica serovar Livingstone]
MKRRSSFLVFLGLLLASPLALANDKHTVSFGYAQTHLSSLKNSDSKDLRGFNFKYRYEFNETWGMLGSFTATRNEMENYTWKDGKLHKNGSDSVDYGSLMFGPTYRFNDYVSLYGNAGIATMKFNKHSKEDSFAYGAGVIFNPVKSISIDASWEASRFFAVDTNTFGVSVGYRF